MEKNGERVPHVHKIPVLLPEEVLLPQLMQPPFPDVKGGNIGLVDWDGRDGTDGVTGPVGPKPGAAGVVSAPVSGSEGVTLPSGPKPGAAGVSISA